MASYVAQTERMVQLAKDRGIEPTAEGLAEATGLSVRVMRGVLAGHPISNRTWQALARVFGTHGDDLFAEAGSPKGEEEARAEQLARLRDGWSVEPVTPDTIRLHQEPDTIVEMRLARDMAAASPEVQRASGKGAKHAAAFMREQQQRGQRVPL